MPSPANDFVMMLFTRPPAVFFAAAEATLSLPLAFSSRDARCWRLPATSVIRPIERHMPAPRCRATPRAAFAAAGVSGVARRGAQVRAPPLMPRCPPTTHRRRGYVIHAYAACPCRHAADTREEMF